MPKPYFLTRQTAKLMEDLVRDLKSGTGVYLLYGDEGVGKTRLLEELALSQLRDVKVRWLDLKAGNSGDSALVDSSVMIEDVFARAETGEVIIADHFEGALKKTRHQLFMSWSTDGADKQINLIIAGDIGYFDDLRQLAQQYKMQAQSFQLMPFSADESASFLGFYLFPDRPDGKLSVPPLLRNQISMAQGNVGKIVEIAERTDDQISLEPLNDTESIRKGSRTIASVVIAGVVILATGGYFYGSSTQMFDSPAQKSGQVDETPVISAEHPVIIRLPVQASQPAVPLEDTSLTADATEGSGNSVVDEVDDATASVDGLRSATSEVVVEQAPDQQDEAASDDTAPANVSQAEPALAQAAISVVLPPIHYQPGRLLQDLRTSLEWINSRDSRVGTIQIMLLSQEHFDDRAYYKYLDRLSEHRVDISKVRIFATYTGDQKVFSVVYGEYQNRGAANFERRDLPPILQDTVPIGRSVGGLMEEIQRLEGKN